MIDKKEMIRVYYQHKLRELHEIYPHELPPSFFANRKKLREEMNEALRNSDES